MTRYRITYKNCKCTYTAGTLDHTWTATQQPPCDDHDYLRLAVLHFCDTHMMAGCNAHCDLIDTSTRGNLFQDWRYAQKGMIYAETIRG